jgi:replicative DNA helicase
MTDELRLLTKVIDGGDLRPLIKANITIDHFKTEQGQFLFRLIKRYHDNKATFGLVPERAYVLKRLPKFPFAPEERITLEAVLQEFKLGYLKEELLRLSDHIQDYKDNPEELLDHVGKIHHSLSKSNRISEDHILSAAVGQIRERYEVRENKTGLLGIPYPWEPLNDETNGLLNGEFIIFYGRPKSQKTFLLLLSAYHAYEKANRRILICTREMTPIQIMDRFICIMINAPYDEFKKGLLHTIPVPEGGTMRDRFMDIMNSMSGDEEVCKFETGRNKSVIITSDRADPKGGGVRGLRRKVLDYKPDVLYVDAVYLMTDDREGKQSIKHHNQAAISQDLKNLALDFNIPVCGTNQANRNSEDKPGKSVSNISFSDSYGQDCDLAAEIIKKPTGLYTNNLAIVFTASRETTLAGFALHGNACTDFSCIMQPNRNGEGITQVDSMGNILLTPKIFRNHEDILDFLNDRPTTDKIQPSAIGGLNAAHAFKEARRSKG